MDKILETYLKRLEVETAISILTAAQVRRERGDKDKDIVAMFYGEVNGRCSALREYDDMMFEIDFKRRRYTEDDGSGILFDEAWATARLEGMICRIDLWDGRAYYYRGYDSKFISDFLRRARLKLGRGGNFTIRMIEMTEEEYQAIPATSDAAALFAE